MSMTIVDPITIDDNKLLSSNIVEGDAPLWDSEETYSLGERVILLHRVYESAIDDNTDLRPDQHLGGETPKWIDLGATNRWRMFDLEAKRSSQRAGPIVVELDPGSITDAVACINLRAATVRVEHFSGVDGSLVYDATKDTSDHGGIQGWKDWWYWPAERKQDVSFFDMPAVAGRLRVTITPVEGGVCAIGELVVGQQRFIGHTQQGTVVEVVDRSTQKEEFGDVTFRKRGWRRDASYPVMALTPALNWILIFVTRLRARPALYFGVRQGEETLVFGYLRRLRTPRASPEKSPIEIEVMGALYEEIDESLIGVELETPAIVSPEPFDALPINGVIRSTPFSVAGGSDLQDSADWQIASDSGFETIVEESMADAVNLNVWPLSSTLTPGNVYYARKRDNAQTLGPSQWSPAVQFTASAAATIDTPTITAPDGVTPHGLDAPMTTSAFATSPGGVDEHRSMRWHIATEATFAAPIVDVTSTDQLTSILPPTILEPSTIYYLRMQQEGRKLGWSAWSATVSSEFVVGSGGFHAIFDTPGSYPFEVPTGVTSISAVGIGAGGKTYNIIQSGGQWFHRGGGSGGDLRWRNAITVTPGETLTVVVGQTGVGNDVQRITELRRGATVLLRAAFYGSSAPSSTIGGDIGGGNGRPGDGGYLFASNFYPGGGGGAGGYAGAGGYGRRGQGNYNAEHTKPQTSSGAGAGVYLPQALPEGNTGGGVGLFGLGADGYGNGAPGSQFYGEPVFGGGASGGSGGIYNSPTPVDGQDGALRIVWGDGRAFPATNVG